MSEYTVTVDRAACDGVFACLVRDPRFVEDGDGLAAIDPDEALSLERDDDAVTLTARFDDERREEAEQAAAACPLDAIEISGSDADPEEVDA